MLRVVTQEFRTAPVGTTSACIGLVSVPAATLLSAPTSAAAASSFVVVQYLPIALLLAAALAIALAVGSNFFQRTRTPAIYFAIFGSAIFLAIGAGTVAEAFIFKLSPLHFGFLGSPRLLYPVLITLPAWFLYSAMLVERRFAQGVAGSWNAMFIACLVIGVVLMWITLIFFGALMNSLSALNAVEPSFGDMRLPEDVSNAASKTQ